MATTVIKFRRGTTSDWDSKNPILATGEPGFEIDTGRYKIGNGSDRWDELPYFIDQAAIEELIAAGGGGGGTALTDHIESELPHPVYDDGTSLVLLYENAKV